MSKQLINLRITNRQYAESLEPKGEAYSRELTLEDEFTILTEGTMYIRDAATYITYDEPEQSGLDNVKTLIKADGSELNIRRFGKDDENDMNLTLCEGVLNITRYHVPMGRLNLEVYTHKLEQSLSEDGFGSIKAEYTIRFDEYMSARNKLEIEVIPS